MASTAPPNSAGVASRFVALPLFGPNPLCNEVGMEPMLANKHSWSAVRADFDFDVSVETQGLA